jgi:hypothetical protein
MKTNPEEFVAESSYGVSKWGGLLQEFRPYIDKEDLEVFDTAHKEAIFQHMQQRFTEAVMEELIEPKKLTQQDVIIKYQTKGMPSLTTTLLMPYANTGNVTLNTPIAGVTQTV